MRYLTFVILSVILLLSLLCATCKEDDPDTKKISTQRHELEGSMDLSATRAEHREQQALLASQAKELVFSRNPLAFLEEVIQNLERGISVQEVEWMALRIAIQNLPHEKGDLEKIYGLFDRFLAYYADGCKWQIETLEINAETDISAGELDDGSLLIKEAEAILGTFFWAFPGLMDEELKERLLGPEDERECRKEALKAALTNIPLKVDFD